MNLLGAKLYDPTAAASFALTTATNLVALDTANLRLNVTIPSHGYLRVRQACAVTGGTANVPGALLGVTIAGTSIGRVIPVMSVQGTSAAATSWNGVHADYTIVTTYTGAQNLDAAAACQVPVAGSALRWGGPNTTGTGTNAYGGFVYEIWDPRPLPTAVPGAAGGVFIAGANALTTATFVGNISGNVTGTLGTCGVVSGATVTGGTIGIVAGGTIGAVTGSVNSVTSAVVVSAGTVGIVQGGTIGAVTGSVNSVTTPVTVSGGTLGIVQNGTIGAVTGAVGSVTNAVTVSGGTLGVVQNGTIGAVTGSVGSVTNPVTVSGGTIGVVQNGTIGAVTGAVGSVTGAVG